MSDEDIVVRPKMHKYFRRYMPSSGAEVKDIKMQAGSYQREYKKSAPGDNKKIIKNS